jgi:hypothetical protein
LYEKNEREKNSWMTTISHSIDVNRLKVYRYNIALVVKGGAVTQLVRFYGVHNGFGIDGFNLDSVSVV